MTTTSKDRRLLVGVLVAAGALVLLPVLFATLGGLGMSMGMWGMDHGPYGQWGAMDGTVSGWFLVVALLSRLLLFAVVLGGAVLLYSAVTDGDGRDDAMAELRRAYARGDLTDEEFGTRRRKPEESE
jgi:putative membrane protein